MTNYTGFPTVYGQVPRVKMVNLFPSYDLKDLRQETGTFSGIGAGDPTLRPASEVEGTLLAQLASVTPGDLIIRVRNTTTDEVIKGRYYLDGSGNARLEIQQRQAPYAEIKVKAHLPGGDNNFDYFGNCTDNPLTHWEKTELFSDPGKVIAPEGFISGVMHYRTPVAIVQETVYAQMRGFDETNPNIILHDKFITVDNPTAYTLNSAFQLRYSTLFDRSSCSAYEGWPVVWSRTSYLDTAVQDANLYFVVPEGTAPALVDGDGWELVNADFGAVNTDTYIKTREGEVVTGQFYAETAERLVRIPASYIVSLDTNITAGGVTGLTRLRLSKPPFEMTEFKATSNVIYCDTKYLTGREHSSYVVRTLISDSQDGTLPDVVSTNYEGPYIGFVAKGDLTLTEWLDRICFQCGTALYYNNRQLSLDITYTHRESLLPTAGTLINGETHVSPYCEHPYSNNRIYEYTLNSATTTVDRIEAREIDASGFEFPKVYGFYSFGAWEDPFSDKFIVNTSRKFPTRSYLQKEYDFDCISDSVSYNYAAGVAGYPGHAAQYISTARRFSFETSLEYMRFLPLTIIELPEFPMLTSDIVEYDGVTESLEVKDAEGRLFWKLNDNTRKRTIPGLVMITGMTLRIDASNIQFSIDGTMIAGQADYIYGGLTDPPIPGIPNPPSGDPTAPPGNGGNIAIGGSGGWKPIYSPVSVNVTTSYDPDSRITGCETTEGIVKVSFSAPWADILFRGACVTITLINSSTGAQYGSAQIACSGNGPYAAFYKEEVEFRYSFSAAIFMSGPESPSRTFTVKADVVYNATPYDNDTFNPSAYNYSFNAGSLNITLEKPPGIIATGE